MKFKDCIKIDNNLWKISLKIVPNSSKNEFVWIMADWNYKIKIQAAPEKNKANKAIIKLISSELDISQGKIKIISGETQPKKLISIDFSD
jgi:uncharacterized protein (TIGR00251 family)